MKESIQRTSFVILCLLATILPVCVAGQQNLDSAGIRLYEKKEITWGVLYRAHKEREELFTANSKQYEQISMGEVKFRLSSRHWNFLDFKQEELELNLDAGPLWGNGNWIDSTYNNNNVADHSIVGLRFNVALNYANRFYYSDKSYTLIQLNANARYDLFRKHSEGNSIDSNGVSTDFDVKSNQTKFRSGFTARAGWGLGRLNPVNHLMVVDYLFDNYYKGRTFSMEETNDVVHKIEEIKNGRNALAGHNNDKESAQIVELLNHQMFLTRPENFGKEWKFGEFLPRFSGSRLEFGPFFSYYNREPDFVYGGYIQYGNDKYCNYKWNRKFNVGAKYNWYKEQDLIMAEIELGWSYFIKLKSQFDFGLKYIPGVTLKSIDKPGKLNHGFIPYIGYFSQINEATRLNFACALRISENKEIMLPGPEFSISVYRSRY